MVTEVSSVLEDHMIILLKVIINNHLIEPLGEEWKVKRLTSEEEEGKRKT